MDRATLYKQLTKIRNRREALDHERAELAADATVLLRQVEDVEGAEMTRAAEALGVSRFTAYKMLKGD